MRISGLSRSTNGRAKKFAAGRKPGSVFGEAEDLKTVATSRFALGIGAVAALLAGCVGSQQPGAVPNAAVSRSSDVLRSGVAPQFASLLGRGSAGHRVRPGKGGADLFVDDLYNEAVYLFKNKNFASSGTITDGIDGPDGNWFANGRLYVANYAGVDVDEYSGPSKMMFTYSAGMIDPVEVTTDSHGNVYEADYGYGSYGGSVNEYAQGSNTVIASCIPGGGVEGVAVDKQGNVFVDYVNSYGQIVEYAGGLTGCNGHLLPITLTFAGGLAIDESGNLLSCDQDAHAVYISAPPYKRVTRKLGSGFLDPFHVTINERNKLAYIVDFGHGEVDVVKYPSGKNVVTLGSANGLSAPGGAVDADNFVP